MSRRQEWAAITLILLLAATLRGWMLGQVPPGLEHDEVDHWLIARQILAGRHAIYFTAAYGHEPLYHYIQASTLALLGDHWLGLRFTSVAFGLIGLSVTYVLTRRLFGATTALLTAGWLALAFWPLFYARVGLRAISLPVVAGLSAYFLFRAIAPQTALAPSSGAKKPLINWLLAGLFLGLSFYTYMASRILPALLVVLLVYLRFVSPTPRLRPAHLAVFALIATLVSAPLVIWLATHPGAEYRIAEVREPLDRLFRGDPSLVWRNFIANLKFFTISGDPWAHQNIPHRPVFTDPLNAALFYAGVGVAVWRWRDPRYGFLLLWLGGALIPSSVTTVPPNSVRNILGLPVTFVFPALGLGGFYTRLKTGHRFSFAARWPMLLLPLILTGILTGRDYFGRWPRDETVRYFYQADLNAIGQRLDDLPPSVQTAVAGLSVASMDGPTLELATRRDVDDVRLCDVRETLIVPTGDHACLFVPQIVPFDPDLQARLLAWGAAAQRDSLSSFTAFCITRDFTPEQDLETTAALPTGAPVALPVSFGGQLELIGYEWLQPALTPGGNLALLTYWRVQEPPPTPLKIFVHLTGVSSVPIAQHDGLGSLPQTWSAGDLVVQKHVIPIPVDLPVGRYALWLGMYDPSTSIRLPVLGIERGTDRLLIHTWGQP